MFKQNTVKFGFLLFFLAVAGIMALSGVFSETYRATFVNRAAEPAATEDDNYAEGLLRVGYVTDPVSENGEAAKYFLDTGVEKLEIFNPDEAITSLTDGTRIRIAGYRRDGIFIYEQGKIETEE